MPENILRAADLNLLVLLRAVLVEKNLSKAAKKMNLTQPAMSRALARLRDLFGDELLVRNGQTYIATARAEQLLRELNSLLPSVERLFTNRPWRPADHDGEFRVHTSDFLSAYVVPPLLRSLRPQAPKLKWSMTIFDDNTAAGLDAGHVDLALWVNKCPPHLKWEFLFRDQMVCVMRKGHPLATGAITLNRYLKHPHVAISITNRLQETVDLLLEANRTPREISIRSAFIGSAVFLLPESDLVLTIPSRMVNRLPSAKGVVVRPGPAEFARLDYIQIWHPRMESDPLSMWIRSEIKATCKKLESET